MYIIVVELIYFGEYDGVIIDIDALLGNQNTYSAILYLPKPPHTAYTENQCINFRNV
jgi:hypothetical protein